MPTDLNVFKAPKEELEFAIAETNLVQSHNIDINVQLKQEASRILNEIEISSHHSLAIQSSELVKIKTSEIGQDL